MEGATGTAAGSAGENKKDGKKKKRKPKQRPRLPAVDAKREDNSIKNAGRSMSRDAGWVDGSIDLEESPASSASQDRDDGSAQTTAPSEDDSDVVIASASVDPHEEQRRQYEAHISASQE